MKPDVMDAAVALKGRSLWKDAWTRLLRNRAALASMIILGLIAALAVLRIT